MSVAENDIRKASDKFYAALNRMLNGDPAPMVDAWSHNSDVSTMHPIGGSQIGWDEGRASWENQAKICSKGQIRLSGQRLRGHSCFSHELGAGHLYVFLAGNDRHTKTY